MKHGSWRDILLLSTYYTHTHTHAVPRPSVKKHTCVNQYEKAQHTTTQIADYTSTISQQQNLQLVHYFWTLGVYKPINKRLEKFVTDGLMCILLASILSLYLSLFFPQAGKKKPRTSHSRLGKMSIDYLEKLVLCALNR